MALDNIKVNNQQVISVDDKPISKSQNLVKSDGVFSNTLQVLTTDSSLNDLDFSDQDGNVLVRFKDGHIMTKNFDSSDVQECIKTILLDSSSDLDFSDQDGNVLVRFKDGHIMTKNFDSSDIQTIQNNIKTNTLYKTNSFEDFTGNGWTYSNKSVTNSIFGYNNKFELTRDYNILDRATFIDFKTTSSAIVYLGYRDVYLIGWKAGSLISVDFAQSKLNIHSKITNEKSNILNSVSFNTTFDTKHFYRLLLRRHNSYIIAELYNLSLYEKLAELSVPTNLSTGAPTNTAGLCEDVPFFFSETATVTIYNFEISLPINPSSECLVYIVGDSITEGHGVDDESHIFGNLLAEQIGKDKVHVSGRCGAKIDQVTRKITYEAKPLSPKYVMVTIGTNGGNTFSNLTELIDKILSIDAIPIINHVPGIGSINTMIDNVLSNYPQCFSVKFDVATSIDKDISKGHDSSFYFDGAHPNALGHAEMYKQILIDCPFLAQI